MIKALAKYLQNRELAIDSLLTKPKSKYTPGTFHKLRVEIKKLHALFDLINFCAKDFKRSKTFQPFKQVFRQAGIVRELQLETTTLKWYLLPNSLKDYRAHLRQLRLQGQHDYFAMIDEKLIAQLKKKLAIATTYLPDVNRKKTARYLEKKKATIQTFLQPSGLQTAQLHELRKHIKVFQYNGKLLSVAHQSKAMVKKDMLPVWLGKWHDGQVMSGHLQKVIESGKTNPKETREIKKIKSKILSDSTRLLSQIKTAIPASECFEQDNNSKQPTSKRASVQQRKKNHQPQKN